VLVCVVLLSGSCSGLYTSPFFFPTSLPNTPSTTNAQTTNTQTSAPARVDDKHSQAAQDGLRTILPLMFMMNMKRTGLENPYNVIGGLGLSALSSTGAMFPGAGAGVGPYGLPYFGQMPQGMAWPYQSNMVNTYAGSPNPFAAVGAAVGNYPYPYAGYVNPTVPVNGVAYPSQMSNLQYAPRSPGAGQSFAQISESWGNPTPPVTIPETAAKKIVEEAVGTVTERDEPRHAPKPRKAHKARKEHKNKKADEVVRVETVAQAEAVEAEAVAEPESVAEPEPVAVAETVAEPEPVAEPEREPETVVEPVAVAEPEVEAEKEATAEEERKNEEP